MPPYSDIASDTVHKKCGEIIITMENNTKKVYSFNCWFCDTCYTNMRKFTLHMEKEHESQLEQATDHKEAISGIECADSTFIAEIKVEDCLVDDMKSENEEEHHNVVTRNSKKKEISTPSQDPLETTENTVEEISSTLPIKQEMYEISTEILDKKKDCETDEPKDDIEMTSFSDDNANADDRSDFSADEENSSSSDYKPDESGDEDQQTTKRAKHKNSIPHERELITALIDAFKSMPQLWDVTQPERCSIKQKEDLLRTITDNLNVQLKQNLKLSMIKEKIKYICKEYEKETETRMNNNDAQDNAKMSDVWYYENMEFLKSLTENKLKRISKPKVKPLNDKLLDDLIDIYKNYNSLWDVNHLAFTVKDTRHQTMQTMLEEIQTKMNLNLDIYKLEKHLAHIHKSFAKDKLNKLQCEQKQQDFQPSCSYYSKCDFLHLHQGPFCCPMCNEILRTYNDLQVHRSTHDGTAPFKCQECGSGFNKIGNFTIHVRRHLGVFKFHCRICGKGYPVKTELDFHMLTHSGATPYLCSICGEGFRRASAYDNHIRRHEERFRYCCDICKRGFNDMTRLNDHVKAHLNVRDAICSVCGKGFTSRKYLNHHKRIHEGKNYVCNICGKGFAQDVGLRAHKKYHGTPIGISSIQKEQNKHKLLS